MIRSSKGATGAPSGQPDGATPVPAPRVGRVPPADDLLAHDAAEAVDSAEVGHAVPARPSRRLEIVCAAIAVVGSGALLLLARAVEVRNETGGIDPRWWPELLGIAGLALGALLLVVAVVRPPFDRDDLEAATRQGWLRVGLAIVLSVAFVLLWPVLGFLVVSPIFLVAATYLFGGRGWKTLILFPVLMTGFIYLLFHTLLKVPL
jgi:hypothetical protein